MALNLTGPISIGGATTGESINLELGQAATATASLNDTNVRTLAGVASGAITMPTNFYGKSAGPVYTAGLFYGGFSNAGLSRAATRINNCGVIIGSETLVTAFGCAGYSGAPLGGNGIFYGGSSNNSVIRINSSGAQVGSSTNVGTQRNAHSGSLSGIGGSNLLVWGGFTLTPCGCCCIQTNLNTVTRVNSSGALVGVETAAGPATYYSAGAPVGSNAMFWGNQSTGNQVVRINSSGAQVGSTTNAGTGRLYPGGAAVGGNGMYFAGQTPTYTNTLTRVNACGILVGSETNAGTVNSASAGASVGSNAMFYGGANTVYINSVVRVNSSGALVGSVTSVGTARNAIGGAST